MIKLSDVGERGLLQAIARRLGGAAHRGVHIGVGDDAAVLAAVGPRAVLTTDLLVEGVDFAWAWARPEDVGHKAAAVNLSDLAAMGATPRALLLSLALQPGAAVRDVLALVTAVHRLGARFGAPLVGGDLSSTAGPLVVSVTAIGEATRGRILRRHAAVPGDVVLVSGTLGEAAAGLRLLAAGRPAPARLARRQLRPTPRVALGEALGRSRLVHSCADVSDGLATDALHLVAAGCGVEIDPEALPVPAAVRAAAADLGVAAVELALAGGEDFELVLAAPAASVAAILRLARRLRVPLHAVGTVTRRRGVRLRGAADVAARGGFDHFRADRGRARV